MFKKVLNLLKNKEFALFLKYIFFAGLATFVDFGVLFLLTDVFKIWYFISAIFSYLCGMITNFTLNKILNFENKSKKILYQFGLFAFVASIGLGLNQLILFILVEKFHIWYIIGKLVSVFIVMFWSFFGHKKITFHFFK
ncbi:MAG TPA: GtrA family protein [Spirochaetota bacterium]|nr:GtrA family protein [Spirochaetota bacterium]